MLAGMAAANIDVSAIVESIRKRVQLGTAGRPRTPPFVPHLSSDTDSLRQSTDLFHLPLVSARSLGSSAMALVRKVMRRLLLPWIVRQSSYNATNVHLLESVRDQLE